MDDFPKQLGDFEILRELGRGGMGVVYEAKQSSLNRRVALKVLSSSLALSAKAIVRFKREAEAAAKLHHTNIVPVYSIGEENRIPYYAMELVDGPSLDQVIRSSRQQTDKPLSAEPAETHVLDSRHPDKELPDWVATTISLGTPANQTVTQPQASSSTNSALPKAVEYFDNVAKMFAGVADALAHAHDLGVIHRDIKPSNLLLSPDGRLSVNDFGLARMLEQPGMTLSGELMGSPMYMSPEQIAAGRLPLDHRTDIYSLGATLYELLTLQPPFDGLQRDQVLSQIVHKEPLPPTSIDKFIPRDLETICLKAMEKDPDRRYQSAATMGEDLKRFVTRHPISARRIGPIERAGRWARKHKAVVTMATVTLTVTAASLLFVFFSARAQHRQQLERDAITAAMSGKSNATDLIAQAQQYGASKNWGYLLQAQLALFNGDNEEALRLLRNSLDANLSQEDKLTAQAMLADAYLRNGDYTRYRDVIRELELAQIHSDQPETLVFLGRALIWRDPAKAVDYLEQATTEKNFPIAYAVLANAKAMLALETQDAALGSDATQAAAAGTEILKDSPVTHSAQLFAKLARAALEPDQQQATQHLEGAERNVDYLLTKSPEYMRGLYLVGHYYLMTRQYDKAIEVMESYLADKDSLGYVIAPYFYAAIESGEPALRRTTLTLLERVKNPHPTDMFFRVLLLLSMKTADGTSYRVDEAKSIMSQLLRERKTELWAFDVTAAWLVGDDESVRKWAASSLKQTSEEHEAFDQKVLQFLAGDLGPDEEAEAELLKAAGNSARYLGQAHNSIGLRRLYQGKRSEAWASFNKSVESGSIIWAGTLESRVFLALHQEDDSWPSWLQPKPETPLSN